MFSIMHISDLHRADVNPITNLELLSALAADRERFGTEVRPISLPDALVVSGDLVQGLLPGASSYPHGLRDQYLEAAEFLNLLVTQFFSGDKSKVVLVPGNHDVDWTASKAAMTQIDLVQPSARERTHFLLTQPNTMFRWDWNALNLYEITDKEKYNDRLAPYRQFAETFYRGTQLTFDFDANRDWNIFTLNNGNLIIAAFNSCSSNDCFSFVGHIRPDAISECHMKIQQSAFRGALRVAVWHHNVEGPPASSDYLDPALVRLMIDKGFAIGMHGHQHKSEASPSTLYTSDKYEMAIFSAGSLGAGSKALPQGYNPQYNVLEIDGPQLIATVHVREMIERGIFAPGRLKALSRESHVEVALKPSPTASPPFQGSVAVQLADQIEQLRLQRRYSEAIGKIDIHASALGAYGRKLKIETLRDAEDWGSLVVMLTPPQELSDALLLIRAHIERNEAHHAENALAESELKFAISKTASSAFRSRIAALKALGHG